MSKPAPCRHLDYREGSKTDCTIATAAPHFPEVRFWRRGPTWTDDGNEEIVQFCTLRGRIRGVFQCYNLGELRCYEPATDEEVKP